MEFYSLEEDDANELFITQESRDVSDNVVNVTEKCGFNYDCLNLTQESYETKYLDISDEEAFQIPSSQINDNNKRIRYILIFEFKFNLCYNVTI